MTSFGRWSVRVLWALAAVAALVLLGKSFLADVYRVKSSSMRPTIFGGPSRAGAAPYDEWVLVRYDRRSELRRFDLIVLNVPEGGDPLVKRVIGLPNETLLIRGGDLFFVPGDSGGGKPSPRRLAGDVPRPALIPVFDSATLDVAEAFEFKRAEKDSRGEPGPWREEAGAWWVDALSFSPSDGSGRMHYHHDLDDGYLDAKGQRVDGWRQVNDGALELEFQFLEPGPEGALRFYLVEEGDTFEISIEGLADMSDRPGTLRLTRSNPAIMAPRRERDEAGEVPPLRPVIGPEVLVEAPVRLTPGEWVKLRFSNVDNLLRVRLPDHGLELSHGYEANVPHQASKPAGQKSLGPRVGFGAGGTRAGFRRIRILRDLYYVASGEFGVDRPFTLGPDEIFVLGDNSAASTDSRDFGPLPLGDVLGRPMVVVWPRFRRLQATVDPVSGAE